MLSKEFIIKWLVVTLVILVELIIWLFIAEGIILLIINFPAITLGITIICLFLMFTFLITTVIK